MRLDDLITWQGLLDPVSEAGVTPMGREVLVWAASVHEQFFGQPWLDRAQARRDVPFLRLGLWPVTGQGAVLRFIERACQLALLEGDWRPLRQQVQNDAPTPACEHLRLVLEIAGLAIRTGWKVKVEPRLPSGRTPDLLLNGQGGDVVVEVTRQSRARDMRAVEHYGAIVAEEAAALEWAHGVVVTVRSEDVLSDDAVRAWFSDAAVIAALIKPGVARQVRVGRNVLTLHPAGTAVRKVHDGPSLTADAWPRIAERLRAKVEQTRSGPPAWIRLECDPSLLTLTSLAKLSAVERLDALARNVDTAVSAPHVLGVLLGLRPSPSTRTEPVALALPRMTAAAQPVAMAVPLPGGWARLTYVLPNPHAGSSDALDPGRLFGSEGSWLAWALARLGQPHIEQILPAAAGEGSQ